MDFCKMMKVQTRVLMAAAAVSAGLLVAARPASAALVLQLSEPGQTTLIRTDTTSSGSVDFVGTYGDFATNFVVGVSNELTATGPLANLEITSLDVTSLSNAGAETLTIRLTDSGYTFPGTSGSTVVLGSSIGGAMTGANAGDSVTFQSYANSPAITTGLQSFAVPTSPGASTPFSSAATPVNFVRGDSFALADVTTISLSGAGETANISGTTTVSAPIPEPAAAAILAAASLVLLVRRRFH